MGGHSKKQTQEQLVVLLHGSSAAQRVGTQIAGRSPIVSLIVIIKDLFLIDGLLVLILMANVNNICAYIW